MNIIIVGCGRVGSQLAMLFSESDNNVVVIDNNPKAFNSLGRSFGGQTIVGVGFDEEILLEAGVFYQCIVLQITEWIPRRNNSNSAIISMALRQISGVGAGDLVFSVTEGTFRRANTDHRLQNIAKAAGTTLGIDIDPLVFNGFTTDATTALHSGARAISILGVQGKMPAGWRWSTDKVDLLEERNLQDAVDVILEMIKNS